MSEIITLTTPIAKPSQTTVKIERLYLDVVQKSVLVQFLGENSEPGSAFYPTPAPDGSSQPTGASLITTLNKMNFSGANPSLANRILARLQADGYVGAGTISGTPD